MLFCLMADLLERLERLRGSEKTVGEVGTTLLGWVSEKITMYHCITANKNKGLPFHSSQSLYSLCIGLCVCFFITVPLLGGICDLLLQSGGGQSPVGPEEAGEASRTVFASVSGVIL